MNKQHLLDEIFDDFLSGTTPQEKIALLVEAIDQNDIPWLMQKIESLNDPSDYFTGTNVGDEAAVSGFFLFIDLVSAFIIILGDSAGKALSPYESSNRPYVAWVLKYVSDERFKDELISKFGFHS